MKIYLVISVLILTSLLVTAIRPPARRPSPITNDQDLGVFLTCEDHCRNTKVGYEPNKGCAECCKSKGHGATNGECKPAMYANKPIPNVSMQCHCLSQVTTEIKTESVTNCNKQCQVNHKRFKGWNNDACLKCCKDYNPRSFVGKCARAAKFWLGPECRCTFRAIVFARRASKLESFGESPSFGEAPNFGGTGGSIGPSRQGSHAPSRKGSLTPSRQGSLTPSRQGSLTPSRKGSLVTSRKGNSKRSLSSSFRSKSLGRRSRN